MRAFLACFSQLSHAVKFLSTWPDTAIAFPVSGRSLRNVCGMKQGMNECYDLNSYVGQEVDRDCHIYFFQSGTCSLIYTCPEGMAEPGQRGK